MSRYRSLSETLCAASVQGLVLVAFLTFRYCMLMAARENTSEGPQLTEPLTDLGIFPTLCPVVRTFIWPESPTSTTPAVPMMHGLAESAVAVECLASARGGLTIRRPDQALPCALPAFPILIAPCMSRGQDLPFLVWMDILSMGPEL